MTGHAVLVTNAGLGTAWPPRRLCCERATACSPLRAGRRISDEDLHALFDTNVFGPQRVTRARLPLLLAAKGRVVCIGSQGGSITMPLVGPYTMSKFALEAYADCLRQ